MPIFALYNFDDAGPVAADSALNNGAQDGAYFDGAAPVGGRAVFDGVNDKVKIYPDSEFQLSVGTLEIQFSQDAHVADSPNTVLSRDTGTETPGGYRIEVMPDGSVLISHETAGDTTTFQTEPGFVNPGDEINIVYSWDEANGGSVQISNLTTSDTFEDIVPSGLSMDQGPISQPWMIGAGQSQSDAGVLNNLDNYFQGSVEMFSLSDTVDNASGAPTANPDEAETDEGTPIEIPVLANDTDPNLDPLEVAGTPTSPNGTVVVSPDGRSVIFTPAPGFLGEATINYTVTDPGGLTDEGVVTVNVVAAGRDGYVDGSAAGELIDTGYIGDPDGDFIDNGDAILPGDALNDDRIRAGAGDDTIAAGLGDDLVIAGQGDDEVYGGDGDDSVFGGDGNDTIRGGRGVDALFGGGDRDVFIVDNASDGIGEMSDGTINTIDGGEEGDDFDTLDLRGSGPLRIDYSPTNPENGTVNFFDAAGNPTGRLKFVNVEQVTPCFTPGTMIATPKGEVPVESLKAGDRVITRDNGIQEICWVGGKKVDWATMMANPHLRPIMIRRGSIGNGLPERDMMVSPNHRVLVSNDRTALYFDEHEVLVAAKHLVSGKRIFEVESIGTSYIHFMFDQHEVVLSDGAWTESFQPGDYTLNGMGNAQRNEIFELFPDLKTKQGLEDYTAARRTLKKHEAKLLVR